MSSTIPETSASGVNPVAVVRRGIHTIEVQAPIVAAVGAWIGNASGFVPQRYAEWLTAASLVLITLSRTLAKLSDPTLNLK